MQVSEQLKKFVKQKESLRLNAYLDTRAKPPIPTIGYGQTGPGITMGLTWTLQQAESAFETHIAQFAASVANLLHYPVSQSQFDALVSFAYNCGVGALASSTLLAKLNAGDVYGAAAELTRWDNDAVGIDQGLLVRRTQELLMFCGMGYGSAK